MNVWHKIINLFIDKVFRFEQVLNLMIIILLKDVRHVRSLEVRMARYVR